MRAGKVALGAVGCAMGGYGAYLLVSDQNRDELLSTGTWLIGGVLLHDVVLAPLVFLLVLILVRTLPEVARGPAVAGVVVLGSTTLWAVPVLGRFGAVPSDPTHLDRDYWAGWSLVAALVVLGVVVVSVARARQRRAASEP